MAIHNPPAAPPPPPLPLPAQAQSLDDLIPGPNVELIAAVRQLAAAPRPPHAIASIYLWGDAGSGKSAILRAACRCARAAARPAHYIAAARGEDTIPPPSDALLAIDDIANLPPAAQITMADWHNRAGRQRLLAGGESAPAASALHPALASRIAAGLVFRIQPLSDADKQQALATAAKRRGFSLPPQVAELLLARLPRGMHTLSAALSELDAFLLGVQKPLTPRIAAKWLAARPPEDTPPA